MDKREKQIISDLLRLTKKSTSKIHPVGCILVNDIYNNYLAMAVNSIPGEPLDNIDKNIVDVNKYMTSDVVIEDENNNTKIETVHAEVQAIGKLLLHHKDLSVHDIKNITLYTTVAPCRHCARLIGYVGIGKVRYLKSYKDDKGLRVLQYYNVDVKKIVIDKQ